MIRNISSTSKLPRAIIHVTAYYLGCEQQKLRDKVRELENSQAQFEKSQAQLIQKNAELSENLESALKLREKE